MNKKTRTGNFSSSSIYKLMKNGKATGSIGAPFYTYVKEKIQEKKTGRPLQKDHSARPTTWGQFVESFAFDKLHWSLELVSKTRYFHPNIDNWCGMPDLLEVDKLSGDIKCPYTLKAFCDVVDAMEEGDVSTWAEILKKVKPEYYYQLVSNAILTNTSTALFVMYVPYFEDLELIQDKATNLSAEDYKKFGWINYADEAELPFLIKGMHYKDLYQWKFEIPVADKLALSNRVILANKEVTNAGF